MTLRKFKSMDNLDELFLLMDLEKVLKPFKYNKLNLDKLDLLRFEVGIRLNQMKTKKL